MKTIMWIMIFLNMVFGLLGFATVFIGHAGGINFAMAIVNCYAAISCGIELAGDRK